MESSTKSRTESRATTLTDLTLRIIEGKLTGQLVKLSATRCTIGAGTNCTLRLRGKNVTAIECEITRTAESNTIRCQSSNTLLNGQPFESSELYNGDLLTVGPITFEIIKGATAPRETLRQEIRSQISASTLPANSTFSAGPIPAPQTKLPIEQSPQSIIDPLRDIGAPAAAGMSPIENLPRSVSELQSSISREEQTITDWLGQGNHIGYTFADHSFGNFFSTPSIDSSSINSISPPSAPASISQNQPSAMRQDEQRNAFAAQSEELTVREFEANARALENHAKSEAIAARLQELTAREEQINTEAATYTAQKEQLLAEIEQLHQDRARLANEQHSFNNDQQQLASERAQLQSYLDSYADQRDQLTAERQAFDDAGRRLIEERKQWLAFVEKTRSEQQHAESELQQRASTLNAIEANLGLEKSELDQARASLAQNLASVAQHRESAAQHLENAAQYLATASQSEADANLWHSELAARAHALGQYTTTIKAKSAELAARQHSLQTQEQQLYVDLSELNAKRQELDMALAAIQNDREQFELERTKVAFQQSTIENQILEQRDLVAAEWASTKRNNESVANEKADLQKRRSELENQYRSQQQQLDQRDAELVARLAAMNVDRQALTTREDELRQLEHSLNRQATNSASTSEEITENLLRLDAERESIRNQFTEIEQKRSDAENEIAKLESVRKAFAEERLEWEEQQASWQAERIRYEEKIVAYGVEQHNIESRFQELELESEKIEQERAEMQKIVDERNEIERESLELKQAIEILEHRRNSLDSELVEIQDKRPELEQTLAQLERATAELTELSSAASEIQSALAATTSEYTEKQTILQNLESELEQLRGEIANLRVEQDRLVAENEQAEELRAEEALAQRLHAEEALTQRLKAEQALTHHSPLHLVIDQAVEQNDDSAHDEPTPTAAPANEDAIFERLKNFTLLKSTPATETTPYEPAAAVREESNEHAELEQEEVVESAPTPSTNDVLSAFREQFAQEIAHESHSKPEQTDRHEPAPSFASQQPSHQAKSPVPSAKEEKHEEDSIDDYMQQLLQRMRGPGGSPSGGSSPVIERRERDSTAQQSPQTEQRRTSDSYTNDAAQSEPTDAAPPVARPRREPSKASDQKIDMSAMREIANFSARSAVNHSMSKRTASKVIQHVMVGGAALAISAIVLYLGREDSPLITTVGYAGLGLSGAWLAYALFVSRKLIFGEFTMSSLIEASGGDEEIDEENNEETVELGSAGLQTPISNTSNNIFASITSEPIASEEESEHQPE